MKLGTAGPDGSPVLHQGGEAAASAKGRFLSLSAVAGGSECNIHPINGVNPAAGTGFNSLYFSRLWDTCLHCSQRPISVKWGESGSFWP